MHMQGRSLYSYSAGTGGGGGGVPIQITMIRLKTFEKNRNYCQMHY